jgi:hypothetical protein
MVDIGSLRRRGRWSLGVCIVLVTIVFGVAVAPSTAIGRTGHRSPPPCCCSASVVYSLA